MPRRQRWMKNKKPAIAEMAGQKATGCQSLRPGMLIDAALALPRLQRQTKADSHTNADAQRDQRIATHEIVGAIPRGLCHVRELLRALPCGIPRLFGRGRYRRGEVLRSLFDGFHDARAALL